MEEAGGALSQTNEHMAEFKDVLASGFVPDEDCDTKNWNRDNGHKGADIIRLMVDRQGNEKGECNLSLSSPKHRPKHAFCSNV